MGLGFCLVAAPLGRISAFREWAREGSVARDPPKSLDLVENITRKLSVMLRPCSPLDYRVVCRDSEPVV